ncbi:MAG TPA: glycoside hydrolase family 9 protein [Prolixibacteraceae bacterium]|nr:glycoside hydrolase family 9 protein [Prolixibacteraceae bacterium]HOR99647.1 glycoside hydrolase family 9 protein [Prolixibacteraceae bacterium]HOS89064.1 glycoside hydrolase family 9 protein [Prolixibacteraceae bacterium]HPL44308.1 glycoside hydrolase family 9 protein [Prolixibacteraceae bacterium]HQE50835.1 glycoside hydrolase family 9 protein [Prolixibacteraceae bacterium]
MKKIFLILFLFGLWNCTPKPSAEIVEAVKLNSLGFLPESVKEATITSPCSEFVVREAASGKVVFKDSVTGPVAQEDIGGEVWNADFSGVTTPGTYYIEVPGVGRSIDFPVGEKVYNDAYVTAMRGFYLWRCGMEVDGEHQGNHYHQAACHLNDGYEDYLGKAGSRRDGTGGWHDAGDYGKYVVNAGVTVGVLFLAWEHFQPQLEKISLNLPETAPGFPEFLKEIKWETDWLLKMQYADGSGRVSHKLTRVEFSSFIMADQDSAKRYFTEWSSAATADFVAMMAQAARIFKPYDADYAATCLDAARVSYAFMKKNPEEKGFKQGDFKTGGYQTRDSDGRLWAAAEMWETTGEPEFLADFEKRAADRGFRIDENWDWGNKGNLGMFSYLLSNREGKDPAVREALVKNCLAVAEELVAKAQSDVYRRPLGGRYYWGCNGTVARQTVNLFVANQLQPDPKFVNTALDAVGHLFGRNHYNRSFVTGIGINPPMKPHDRRSGADSVEAPWPGYLVGGGHKATDWVDLEESYSHNEICINWQAPLVFALAWFSQP